MFNSACIPHRALTITGRNLHLVLHSKPFDIGRKLEYLDLGPNTTEYIMSFDASTSSLSFYLCSQMMNVACHTLTRGIPADVTRDWNE